MRRSCTLVARASLLSVLWISCAALSAQSVGTTDQQILAELKAMRTALQKVESDQKALITLIRIQIDESRIASLELQRMQLLASERELKEAAENANAALRAIDNASSTGAIQTADGDEAPLGSVDLTPLRARHAEAVQRASEATSERQRLSESIAALRKRVATLEKSLEGMLR
ncbi:MAG: hypothetical protein KIT83_16125 [Bryobacterales bacterium]|nr:hypothetical protein [Bryobacterales bacterium]